MNTAVSFETVNAELHSLFVFSGRTPPAMAIPVRSTESEYVPALKNHTFDADTFKMALIWLFSEVTKTIFVGGPAGCGKTSFFEQLGARLKIPVYRQGCSQHTRMEDLRGQWALTVKDGIQVTKFIYGPLIMAMKTGGILLLDEADTLHPSTALALNTVLDGAPLLVPETEELIKPHRAFRVAMTGNSMGLGDESGDYKAVIRQNAAVMDRPLLIKADFMDKQSEALILKTEVPTLDGRILESLLNLASEIRKANNSDNKSCEIILSTRGLIRASKVLMALAGKSAMNDDFVIKALDAGFLAKHTKVDRQFAISAAQRVGLLASTQQP